MSAGYDISFSITAVCHLPSNSYMTVSRPSDGPFNRDNPYERKDRRVFITPCMACAHTFKAAAYADGRRDEREEWADLLAAAKCAENVLFLLSKELEAMGNKAPNVRQMLSTAIARVEADAGEHADMRHNERAMEGFLA